MDLILWRHAEAETGSPDSARKLTGHGLEQARRIAAWLKPRLPGNCEILVSPATRAQQTAQALGMAFTTTPAVGTDAAPVDVIGSGRLARTPGGDIDRRTPADIGSPRGTPAIGAEADREIGKGALWWIRHSGGETRLFAAIDPELA